jgi:hypothetical protein
MNNTYELKINTKIVRYEDENGEPFDGDRAVISEDAQTLIMDDDDFLDHSTGVNRANVAWATYVIDTTTDAVHPSSPPIGDQVHEHEWLSGSYVDPYRGQSKVTETAVRLTGDWTPEDRALVFKAIASKYHTA